MKIFVLACYVLVLAVAVNSTRLADEWEVVVRPSQFEPRERARLYWVGLRNTSATPRAFCMLGVRYRYDLKDGTSEEQPTREYPTVGSSHPCVATMGHLVLPRETHFVMVRVVLPTEAALNQDVRFLVTAEETCVKEQSCEHQPITVMERSTDSRE
jgi:hypothetical protein